jgi:hypothetical protein
MCFLCYSMPPTAVSLITLKNDFKWPLKEGESRAQCLKAGFEQVFIQYVKAAPEVVGRKYYSHIGRGVLDAPFGHDVVKIPLPLYHSKRMFHNGLAPALKVWILLQAVFVRINKVGGIAAPQPMQIGLSWDCQPFNVLALTPLANCVRRIFAHGSPNPLN